MVDGKSIWQKHIDSLGNSDVGPGSKEYKIDFHFHTPASKSDYKDQSVTYDQIALELAKHEVDAVFVTDHNCWEGIALLKAACKKNGNRTKVFPGVELTLETEVMQLIEEEKDKKKIGIAKFHCLALFPDDEHFETRIKSLITHDSVDTEILKKEPVDRVLKLKLEVVHEKIKKWGGVFIPAHLNQGKSATHSRSLDDIYSDKITLEYLEKYFDAVEIRKKENAKIFSGEFEISAGQKVPKISCLMGSDAHDLKTIGRKSSYMILENLTFENIRESIKHPDRVSVEPKFKNIDMIQSIAVHGAFIKDVAINFNHRINTFIGAKGSGKTSVIELLRFALGYEVKEEKKNDKKGYLQHILGPAGEVDVVVSIANGDKFLFWRRFSDQETNVFTEDGTRIERGAVIPSLFNLSITSAGEITELAIDRKSQLELIDNYDRSGDILNSNRKLFSKYGEMPHLYSHYFRLDKKFRELKKQVDELVIKEKSLEKLQATSMQKLQDEKEKRVAELQSLQDAETVLYSGRGSSLAMFDRRTSAMFNAYSVMTSKGNVTSATLSNEIVSAFQNALDKEKELKDQLGKEFNAFVAVVKQKVVQVKEKADKADVEYQQEFGKLSFEEQQILIKRNDAARDVSRLPSLRSQLELCWAELHEQLHKLTSQLKEINTLIQTRTEKRQSVVNQINDILTTQSCGSKISFEPYAASSGSSSPVKEDYFEKLAVKFTGLEIDNYVEKVWEPLSEDLPSDYKVVIDDGIEVLFEIYTDQWKKSNQLSSGQKATSVLPLLLIAAKGPIVLDQPEDNLDNKYIGSTTVKMFSGRKGFNQIIMTSHNATLVVMTDSDLIVEMEDLNNNSSPKRSGYLGGPNSTIKDSVLEVLDGGKEALEKRFVKYGIKVD